MDGLDRQVPDTIHVLLVIFFAAERVVASHESLLFQTSRADLVSPVASDISTQLLLVPRHSLCASRLLSWALQLAQSYP